MKRSHTVMLTAVVAAAGVVGAEAQTPASPGGAVDCKEARKAAKRDGTPLPPNCVINSHGVSHGGFGSFGHYHAAGG
jgi:hypothetical protein